MNNTQVFRTWFMLRIVYALVPILLGLDKCFTSLIVDWSKYTSPMIMAYIPLTMVQFLILVGVIEIVAGLIVWFYPRFGGYLIVAWMGLIIFNLLTMGGLLDIILRDVVIAIGALALAWLSDAVLL